MNQDDDTKYKYNNQKPTIRQPKSMMIQKTLPPAIIRKQPSVNIEPPIYSDNDDIVVQKPPKPQPLPPVQQKPPQIVEKPDPMPATASKVQISHPNYDDDEDNAAVFDDDNDEIKETKNFNRSPEPTTRYDESVTYENEIANEVTRTESPTFLKTYVY
jgi:hypothetical protein